MNECLVICQDDGQYVVATRQLMTPEEAAEYVKGIAPDRKPIIVQANVDWQLRGSGVYRYRWQEMAGKDNPQWSNGPINEIWGNEKSLYQVAKRIELPVRPFRSTLYDDAGKVVGFCGEENMPDRFAPEANHET